jgi:hypothetical protein
LNHYVACERFCGRQRRRTNGSAVLFGGAAAHKVRLFQNYISTELRYCNTPASADIPPPAKNREKTLYSALFPLVFQYEFVSNILVAVQIKPGALVVKVSASLTFVKK